MWNDIDSVIDALTYLYGESAAAEMSEPAGIVHVAAVWQEGDGGYVTMRINSDTPKSKWDFFALQVARARADAIVTTGKILRDEPDLAHDLAGAGLAAWRREVLGKTEPPYVLVLTSGLGVPREGPLAAWHPALRGWAVPVIYTGIEAADALRPGAGERILVAGDQSPGLRSAIAYLRSALGSRTIAIEAGPSTANELYNEPVAVDELMLSVFGGEAIPASVRGSLFVAPARLQAGFSPTGAPREIAEPGGQWRFGRLLARQRGRKDQ